MAISMTVRNAGIDDIPEIIELAKKFHAVSGYEYLEFDCDTVERIVMQSIGQELCPVAVIDGEVVGFLLGLQFPALLNANIMVGTEIAWWVEPGHRSKPIGVKLLKYIEKQAQSKKLKFWSMMCLEKLNADGLESIYERMGYKKAERTYIRLF
jgi:GNAT superfamily N-acetyltransferase